ncbi:hypothetical protein RhiirA1_462115 [Rhizophagus irregularis]|uniref:Uncharacterized protein n=1 Tax=Rhizophagus irregularis TaxID=588596 RepID=A0A2N0RMY0_9GLOM|nr:hypothetical protein RhiirA1_462115 [Rhizophagus irregularis]
MNKVFNYHLKKRVLTSINWKNLFIEWQNQKSNFIEITQKLKEIYPVILSKIVNRAWKALLCHAASIWTRSKDPDKDKDTLMQVYNCGFLQFLQTAPENNFGMHFKMH